MKFEVTESNDIRRYKLITDEGREYRQEYKMVNDNLASMRWDYVDNKLVGKYIPCARMDGVVGWYDLIGKRFLEDGETLPFITHTVGTQYINTGYIVEEKEKTDD